MDVQNITLSLPKEVLREVKIIAVRRGVSVSGLLTNLLTDVVRQEDRFETARQRALGRLDQGFDMGTLGTPPATREQLHER